MGRVVLAPRDLPPRFERWNREHRLYRSLRFYGVALRRSGAVRVVSLAPGIAQRCGPFLWQGNTATRLFEYPWAYHEIVSLGRGLRVVDIGGGLSGMQWVLAREGHEVINVDPGLAAAGKGWSVDPRVHRRLTGALGAGVELRPTTIGAAGLADRSADVLLSISTLEHLTPEEVAEFCRHARRVIKADGVAVLTVDLFLDLAPFTASESNRWGRNIDVHGLLEAAGFELLEGTPSELLGFRGFDPDAVEVNASQYLCGRYPALAQCVVARPRADGRRPGCSD